MAHQQSPVLPLATDPLDHGITRCLYVKVSYTDDSFHIIKRSLLSLRSESCSIELKCIGSHQAETTTMMKQQGILVIFVCLILIDKFGSMVDVLDSGTCILCGLSNAYLATDLFVYL